MHEALRLGYYLYILLEKSVVLDLHIFVVADIYSLLLSWQGLDRSSV
jgi:hypothetical protein